MGTDAPQARSARLAAVHALLRAPGLHEGLMIFAPERAEQMQKFMQPFVDDNLVDGTTPATPEPAVTD